MQCLLQLKTQIVAARILAMHTSTLTAVTPGTELGLQHLCCKAVLTPYLCSTCQEVLPQHLSCLHMTQDMGNGLTDHGSL